MAAPPRSLLYMMCRFAVGLDSIVSTAAAAALRPLSWHVVIRAPRAGSSPLALFGAPLFGFAAGPARREDRLPLGLLGGLSTRLLQFRRDAGVLFGLQCRNARRSRFCLGRSTLGRLTLFARLFLSLPCGGPEIAGSDDRLPRLPPLGRFGACRSGFGTLELRLSRFLSGAKPVG
jgi:hypothetical protein